MPRCSSQNVPAVTKTVPSCKAKCSIDTIRILRHNLYGCSNNVQQSRKDGSPSQTSESTTSKSNRPRTASTNKTTAKSRRNIDIFSEPETRTSLHEKNALAIEAANASLRVLTSAAKDETRGNVSSSVSLNQSVTASRSLQEKSPNSGTISPLLEKSPCVETSMLRGNNSLREAVMVSAECGRLAFRYLISQPRTKVACDLSEWQLETGMLAFIGRLIALRFDDMAVGELVFMQKHLVRIMARLKTEPNPIVSGHADVTTPGQIGNLASLLHFAYIDKKDLILQVVIDYQLTVLRLIAVQREAAIVEAALPFLRTSYENSLINLILFSVQLPSALKAGVKQFEILSQNLVQMCPRYSPSKAPSDTTGFSGPNPQSCLQLQTLALEVRAILMGLAPHRGNTQEDIWMTFLKCLERFRLQCTCPSNDQYTLAARMYEDIHKRLEDTTDSDQSTHRAGSPGAHQVYVTLSRLAQSAGMYRASRQWMERLLAENIGLSVFSQAQQCAWYTRLATLNIIDASSPMDWSNVNTLTCDTLNLINGNINGKFADLDKILRETIELRNAAFEFLRRQNHKADPSSNSSLVELKQTCRSVLRSFIGLLINHLNCDTSLHDKIDSMDYRQRWRRAEQLSTSSINLLVVTFNSSTVEEVSWGCLSGALKNCLVLLERLKTAVPPGYSDHEEQAKDDSQSSYVNISGAYWKFHVKLRPEDEQGALWKTTCMEKSCQVLRDRTPNEQEAGSLAWKLYRLGRWLESLQRYSEAADTLFASVQVCISTGILSKAVSAAAACPSASSTWQKDNQIQLLYKAVKAQLELKNKHDSTVPNIFAIADSELPEEEQRGLLLEWQLDILASMVYSKRITPKMRSLVSHLTQLLLQTYAIHKYPIRRRQVALQVLRLIAEDDGIIDPQIRRDVEDCAVQPDTSEYEADSALSKLSSHLQASLSVAITFCNRSSSLDRLEQALSIWASLIDRAKMTSTSMEWITNFDLWRSQLVSVIKYCDMLGADALQMIALQLLLKVYKTKSILQPQQINSVLISLATQYLRLSYTDEAGLCLREVQEATDMFKNLDIETSLQGHLAFFDYCRVREDYNKCAEQCETISKLCTNESELLMPNTSSRSPALKLDAIIHCAEVHHNWYKYHRDTGSLDQAALSARCSVTMLQRTWAGLENKLLREESPVLFASVRNDVDTLGNRLADMAIEFSHADVSSSHRQTSRRGSVFWSITPRLFQAFLDLSEISQFFGAFQDAVFYNEQAKKLADGLSADNFIAQCLVRKGVYASQAGNPDDGSLQLDRAADLYHKLDRSKQMVLHQCSFGQIRRLQGDFDVEFEFYNRAEKIVDSLTSPSFARKLGIHMMSCQQENASLTVVGSPRTKKRTGKTKKFPSKAAPKITANGETHDRTPTKQNHDVVKTHTQIKALKDDVLRRKAESCLVQGHLEDAGRILATMSLSTCNVETRTQRRGLRLTSLLREVLGAMSVDSVFSMLPESTIAFPAVASQVAAVSSMDDGTDDTHVTTATGSLISSVSPFRKTSVKSFRKPFKDLLCETLNHVSEMHSLAAQSISILTLRYLVSASVTASMLLCLTDSAKRLSHPTSVAHALELPRSLSTLRERSAITQEETAKASKHPLAVLSESGVATDTQLLQPGLFYKEFIKRIPTCWTAISLSLSEDFHYLYITKYEHGQWPFVLRLPLTRRNNQESNSDEETFTYEEARSELIRIIEASDVTVHQAKDAPNSSQEKGAKTKWWAKREALDECLHELLLNIEHMWLGGFRGLFSSPQPRRTCLLARFQQSFENILEKHLPSRQATKKHSRNCRVDLHPHVLELFVGLGSTANNNLDLDEALTDLIYFVVDILQFNGEHNAYDEIDFDAVIVETQDALRCYHEAVQAETSDELDQHIILILDKQLHIFPWESLPCLEGCSVSRLSSLSDLRERIITMENANHARSAPKRGVYVRPAHGTFILNPSTDLSKTQSRFETPLSSLSLWSSIIGRPPTEVEFAAALTSPSITEPSLLLYFGHGSGAQYIRAKNIKRLMPLCGIALLFGCSSASLKEAGDFEPYGTPKTYLTAGSPAVLGSLWDVTDGDCDRFASSVLERWGLLETGSCQEQEKVGRKRKGRLGHNAKDLVGNGNSGAKRHEGKRSLSEAVAESRGDCYLKYLNGAAMVVYGVPVYLSGHQQSC